MKKPQKPEIRISINTRMDTTTWVFGQRVLQTFYSTDARLLPQLVGNTEPIKIPVESIAECEKYWAPEGIIKSEMYGKSFFKWDFLWKRTKTIKSQGMMIHTFTNKLGKLKAGVLLFGCIPDKKINWHQTFHQLCELTQPNFATLNLITDIEARRGAFSQKSVDNFGVNDYLRGIGSIALEERGLANLSWATFFGEEYAVEVDVQKLRAHGFSVEEIGHGFLVTLTPSIFDVTDNFPLFSARRVELKKLFREGLFRIMEEPKIAEI